MKLNLPTAQCPDCDNYPLMLVGVDIKNPARCSEIYLLCTKCGKGAKEPLVVELWQFESAKGGNGGA